MLLGREDLRDRVLRLAGSSRLYLTTQALDDAARRVSRYLVMQLAVNAMYGTLVGVGLLLIGVPHPLVWAVLATLLRFIPYLGTWIAAAGPPLLAIGVAPGWGKFALTLGLYAVLELVAANIVEPFLYGSSTGISAIAILGSGQDPPNLFPEHFFDLPDLFFNFAGVVFGFAFSL